MSESERVQRFKEHHYLELHEIEQLDQKLSSRIASLLNHPKIDQYCMVDAYYYDFSVIPQEVQEKLQLWRDAYLIYGITVEGEMVSKWVDRWDLDSKDPIVDGKVIHKPIETGSFHMVPEIRQYYDPKFLSTPAPDFIDRYYRL